VSPRQSPLAGFPPLALSACVPSLQRFYIERDIALDDALLGHWIDKKRGHEWRFVAGCERSYHLVHADEDGRKSEFVAHLFRAYDMLLIDLWPWKFDMALNTLQALHVLPAHNAMLVRQLGPELHLAFLSYTAFRQHLEQNPSAIAHVCPRTNEYVLTAPPYDLQHFIVQQEKMRRTSLFANTTELTRGSVSGEEQGGVSGDTESST
jgi:hypothetical protein